MAEAELELSHERQEGYGSIESYVLMSLKPSFTFVLLVDKLY